MKKYLLLIGLLIGNSYVAMAATTSVAPTTEVYTLDPTHTYVEYYIKHFGNSTQSGKWFATGTLTFDQHKLQNSSVQMEIKMADLVTGIAELDKHLESTEFFNIIKYPTATFVSQKVFAIKNKQFKVTGQLTLHGVTKPVTLLVTQNNIGVNSMTKIKTAGFSATTTIKRSDFGLGSYIPILSDEVKLDIEAEAMLQEDLQKSEIAPK